LLAIDAGREAKFGGVGRYPISQNPGADATQYPTLEKNATPAAGACMSLATQQGKINFRFSPRQVHIYCSIHTHAHVRAILDTIVHSIDALCILNLVHPACTRDLRAVSSTNSIKGHRNGRSGGDADQDQSLARRRGRGHVERLHLHVPSRHVRPATPTTDQRGPVLQDETTALARSGGPGTSHIADQLSGYASTWRRQGIVPPACDRPRATAGRCRRWV
jgi:hypothetical protein